MDDYQTRLSENGRGLVMVVPVREAADPEPRNRRAAYGALNTALPLFMTFRLLRARLAYPHASFLSQYSLIAKVDANMPDVWVYFYRNLRGTHKVTIARPYPTQMFPLIAT